MFVGFTNAAAGGYAVLRNGLIQANADAFIQLVVTWLGQRVGRELGKPPVLHGTMAKVCKAGGEGTFAGTRGNGKVAP